MPEIISGKYVTVSTKEHNGQSGNLLSFINPDSKVNVVPLEALQEILHALDELEEDSSSSFIVFTGASGKVHAGADLALFQGDIDPSAVQDYLSLGATLDFKIKNISRKKKTISIMQGERFWGSVEWPLMTELSVCTPDTAIQFSEVNIGLIPGWAGILNVMLRSNKENARYMAATGNRITAQEMKDYGLVERVAGESILEDALDLATRDKIPVDCNVRSKEICSREKLNKIISERTDARRYQELEKEVSRKLQTNELSNNKGREDYVGRFINHELGRLGKPLAPFAVAAVMELIDQFSDIGWKDLGRIKEMGEHEAQSCFRLMKTLDRRIGVNSVLTSNPVERIPIYVGK